jgi:hypothetical protein
VDEVITAFETRRRRRAVFQESKGIAEGAQGASPWLFYTL